MIKSTRMERNTFGKVAVPNERLCEVHTQRSLQSSRISIEMQPPEFLHALAFFCTD
jgi:fumarate hydratase class II